MLKVAFNPIYVHPLPDNHRFPMEKYDLLPRQLIHEGTLNEENFFSPACADRTLLENVHSYDYLEKLFNLQIDPREQRKTGFVHSKTLIERECVIMEGTRKSAEYALDFGAAMNIAGGTHHAFSDKGEGFCLLNDQAIAANWLLETGNAKNILVIDLDVHQGNGTAEIFKNEERVFTFSMHGKDNYPLKKEISNYDMELETGIKDKEYLYLLENSLDQILSQFKPDFIFYQSGVDIIETDKLGHLAVTMQGCKERDKIVFETVKQLKVPVVCTMGGGYSKEIRDIIEAHAQTFRSIQEIIF